MGVKWLAAAMGESHCQFKLKLSSQMVGCQLVGMECCPFQEQQVHPSLFVLFSTCDGVTHASVFLGDAAGRPDQGIISAAIANAAAVSSPPRSPGNVGLLCQRAATTPTKAQFTFTCESDSSKGMALQAQNAYANRSPTSPLSAMAQNRGLFTTQGTQTSPSMAAQMNQGYSQPQPLQTQQTHDASGGEQANPGRKKKRSPGSIYALAARQRKIQQQYANLHHPPSIEDIWICEFCEYESIFGRPPEALIRQYEVKDRKERKRLAEKKRLLEKAKMKGRKNRKATKNATRNTNQNGAYQPGYDHASVDHSSVGGSHEDDYNEYDEEPVPAPGPPPTSFKPPLPPGNQPMMKSNRPVPKGSIDVGTSRPP